MVGRVLLLIAAFVVAGLGALLVFLYARQADERAIAKYEPVDVVVVQAPVSAGTPVATAVEQQLLMVQTLPGANVPDDAVARLEDIEGLVVIDDLVMGETLVRGRVGDPADQEKIIIPDGLIAASFAFEDPQRVAGFVTPGSEIAVFLTWTGPAFPIGTDVGEGGAAVLEPPFPLAGEPRNTKVLLDRVEVLAVGATTVVQSAAVTPDAQDPAATNGATTDGQVATPVSQTLLTLALTKEQTESAIYGQSIGALYLGLLTDSSEVPPGDGSNYRNLFEVVGR